MKIVSIIVLYNNSSDTIKKLISNLAPQVDHICLIDNSTTANITAFDNNKITYIPQYKNVGIAKAQNVGIQFAIKGKYDFILFSDPDSIIPNQGVPRLMNTYLTLIARGYNVGAIGSTAYNEKTGVAYSISDRFVRKIKELGVTEVSYTMNSISLVPVDLFKKVGMMDEGLFIDGVDDEWCWRASSVLGCRFFIDDKLIIMHNLGVKSINIGFVNVSISSPQRLYYQFRNYFWLKKRKYTPIQWIRANRWKFFVKILIYPIFVKHRCDNLKYIFRGIYEGVRGEAYNNIVK